MKHFDLFVKLNRKNMTSNISAQKRVPQSCSNQDARKFFSGENVLEEVIGEYNRSYTAVIEATRLYSDNELYSSIKDGLREVGVQYESLTIKRLPPTTYNPTEAVEYAITLRI